MLNWLGSTTGNLGGSWGGKRSAPTAHELVEQQLEERRLRDIRNVNRAVTAVLGVSGAVLLLAGWGTHAIGPVLLWAIASIAAGGAVGFLFGIPRAGGSAARAGDTGGKAQGLAPSADAAAGAPGAAGTVVAGGAPNSANGELRPNTNLEEVSDWLTKIIVGLGLVHLQDLQGIVAATAANAAASLSANPTASQTSLATALIVGFAIEGFFLGYIYTRMFLQVAFARSDSDLRGASRDALDRLLESAPVEKVDSEESEAASLPSNEQRVLAEQVERLASSDPRAAIEKMDALAREYERTRSSMASGRERTRRMTDIVSQMTVVALGAESQLERLTASAMPGDRLAAVVILKLRFNIKYAEWLAQRLVDDVPFIGFQAASALLAASRLLGGVELDTLRTAVAKAQQVLVDKKWNNDPPRDRLISQILGTAEVSDSATQETTTRSATR